MMYQDLLGGGVPPISQAPPPPTQLPPDVEAFLMKQGRPPMVPQAPSLAPPSTVPQDAPADEGPEISVSGRNPYERKGLFGIKGTARDILGILGDAFLVQSGNKPMYAPIRERERIADGMRGFTEDAQGSAQELLRLGYPDAARDVYKDYTEADIKRRATSLAEKKYQSDLTNDAYLNKNRQASAERNVLGNIRSSLSGIEQIKDPVQRELAYQRRKQYIEAYVKEYGTPEMAEIVRDTLPANYRDGIGTLFVDPQAQERLEDTDLSREQQAQLAREAEAARNARFQQSESGKESRFQRAERGKDKRAAAKKGPSFKLPAVPKEFQ